jgi:hypothetical protein
MQEGDHVGPYIIQRLLGRGGMAEVYKAWYPRLNCYHALKTPLTQAGQEDSELVMRFLREAHVSARLRHPHIAVIHNVSGEDEAQHYFTMEYIEGEDLSDLIKQRGKMTLEEALPIARQIAEALDYAHANGVVHRDVKPSNVLLEANGQGGWNVKVVDFGIAKARLSAHQETRYTQAGMIVGTPEYMSPEQAEKPLDVDKQSDIYSFGIILYEMLCGHPPFRAAGDTSPLSVLMRHINEPPAPPNLTATGLPGRANKAVLKALAKKPEERFDSCKEFIEALAPVEKPAGGVSRKKISLGMAAAVVAVLLFVGVRRQVNHHQSVQYAAAAARLIDNQDYSQAEQQARQAVRLDSSYPDGWVQYCTAGYSIARGNGQFTAVKERIARAEQACPNNPALATLRGEVDDGIESISKAKDAQQIIDKSFADRTKMITDIKNHQITQETARSEFAEQKKQFKVAESESYSAIQQWESNENAWVQYCRAGYFLAEAKSDYQQTLQRVKEAEKRFPEDEALPSIEANIKQDGHI